MRNVPLGGLIFAFCTLMAVAPIRRPRSLATISWLSSAAPNELPFQFMFIIVISSAPAVASDGFTGQRSIALGLALSTVAGLGIVARRALRARAATEQALGTLGEHWRREIDPALVTRRHLPWLKILLVPWPFRPRDVSRVRDIPYADGGREHLLDIYRHRSGPRDCPTLIYLHGGHFRWGRKSFEARALIHHLARQGWTCISANYRLTPTPAQGFPGHLIDVKRVIAWARKHADEHGIDPTTIFMAGSSAGAHLTAMASVTMNDSAFQPGFEGADTSLAGGIGLYGYYGTLGGDEGPPSTPLAYVNADVPPLFVIHGDHDTNTPVEGARHFVEAMRSATRQPVVYAELPGAQHSFDVFHSIRFETAVNAIEVFTAWVRTSRSQTLRGAHRDPCAASPPDDD